MTNVDTSGLVELMPTVLTGAVERGDEALRDQWQAGTT
jgi:hypothetical protein